MSGRMVGTLVGAAIGVVAVALAPVTFGTSLAAFAGAASIGATVGGLAGSFYDSATQKFDDVVNRQERLADQAMQTSTLGVPMPQIWGTIGGLAGNIWWCTHKIPHEHREEIPPPRSGKGGSTGPRQINISITYTQSYMIRLCDTRLSGPMDGLTRIMRNSNLFWDITQNGPGLPEGWTFYPGTATQAPDPTIEADVGVGNVPRWPYTCYVVVEDDDQGASGQTPIYTFWVRQVTETPSAQDPLTTLAVNPVDDHPWVVRSPYLELWEFDTTPALVEQIPLDHPPLDDQEVLQFLTTGWPITIGASGDAWVADTTNLLLNVVDYASRTALVRAGWESATDTWSSNIVMLDDGGERAWIVHSTLTQSLLESYHKTNVYAATPLTAFASFYWLTLALGDLWAVGVAGTMDRYAVGTGIVSTLTGFGDAWHSVTTPADDHIWVADRGGNVVRRLNTTTELIVATVAVDATPTRLAVASDGYVWVACEGTGTVQRINPATDAVVLTVAVAGLLAQDYAEILAPGSAGSMWVISTGQNTVTNITSAGTLTTERTRMGPYAIAAGLGGTVWVTSREGGTLQQFPGGTAPLTANSLAAVVTTLCTAVGQTAIDLSDLPDGYVNMILLNVEAARVPLEQLALAFRFYAVESGFDLKFREKGSGGLVFAIGEDELGAGEGQADAQGLRVQRAQEADLPTTVEVAFVDPQQNYQRNTQAAQLALPLSGVENARTVNVGSIALGADQARQLAYELAVEAWVQRETLSSTLTRKYAGLEPGDRGTLTARGLTYTVVLGETAYGAPGLVEFTARVDAAYIRNALIPPPGISIPLPQPPVIPGITTVLLLNLGALDSNDLPARYHVAYIGSNEPWEGGALYRSIDNEASYQLQDSGILEGITGTLTGTPPTADWHFLDTASAITVTLEYGALASITDTQLYNGSNLCAIGTEANGWELLGFGIATLVGTRTYQLSRLLRGRRGTEHKVATHGASETFLFLDTSVHRLSMVAADKHVERDYKSVTSGEDIAQVPAVQFTPTAANEIPWSVATPTASLGGSDWTLSWKMRSRFNGDWLSGVGIGFDVDFVGFRIDIFDDGTFTTVVRSTLVDGGTPLDAEGVKTWLYDAAMQTADHGSPQAQIWFRVYQVANNGVSVAEDVTAP